MTGAPEFPITSLLPSILAELEHSTRLVIQAPPGAGKTTRVPPALLDAAWCKGRVLMLEPRRVATRAAARYMADALGEKTGQTIGYSMRFEQRVSAQTRIEVVTEGVLTRMLQDDPTLDGVSAVIFDEFHERSLAADLGLALCLDVQSGLREDLRIVVMSATLDGAALADFLAARRLHAQGRSHEVAVEYRLPRPDESIERLVNRMVRNALTDHTGDILVFLPGRAEIERVARLLDGVGAQVTMLHGDLGIDAQSAVLAGAETRRVILATNVAESSVTIPGVTVVIDAGLAREPRFDPTTGMSRLETVRVSAPSAAQRTGRAGRLGPGTCYRLWSRDQRLDTAMRAEIAQADLAGLLLELKAWGSEDLRFLDAPPTGALDQARELLTLLHAIDDAGRITAHGREILELGVHPRLAHAILATPMPERSLACDIAALLEARDPLRGDARRDDDLASRLAALHALRQRHPPGPASDAKALGAIDRTARQLARRAGVTPSNGFPSPGACGAVLARAYPERVARKDTGKPDRYRLRNGRGARLGAASSLVGSPWLAIAELRLDARDSMVLRAATLDTRTVEALFGSDVETRSEVSFDAGRGVVECTQRHMLGAIELESQRRRAPPGDETARVLCEAIVAGGLEDLPWTPELEAWLARVALLREACPEFGLPDLSRRALHDEAESWLPALLGDTTRLADIDADALASALHQRLDYAQQRRVEHEAPTSLQVPSGARHRIEYGGDGPPVLAVKLQEMFGLADGPSIARGRVPLVLHLLSPRRAPIQVTRDLRSFWANTYPEVKKELKGRYPKHPWPDDPWTAVPTARTKKQRR